MSDSEEIVSGQAIEVPAIGVKGVAALEDRRGPSPSDREISEALVTALGEIECAPMISVVTMVKEEYVPIQVMVAPAGMMGTEDVPPRMVTTAGVKVEADVVPIASVDTDRDEASCG